MVKAMLSSPYVADHKAEAEYWSEALAEVEEIVDLWSTCQKKVAFVTQFVSLKFVKASSIIGVVELCFRSHVPFCLSVALSPESV